MAATSKELSPIKVSDYFESLYSLEGYSFENLNNYADGTLFPVHIGDLFPPLEEGATSPLYRYKILSKIGHGSYSTVWLALDLEIQTHVALKFLSSGRDLELSLSRSLADGGEQHAGQEFVVSLRDSFRVGRANEHAVLVLDVLIPWSWLTRDQKKELDLQSIAFQLSCGLSYLHSKNITHGDLHQGNIALKVSEDFLFDGYEFLTELELPELVPILPIPYSQERARQPSTKYQPPRYLVDDNVFRDYVREVLKKEGVLSTAKLQIIDLSNAYQIIPEDIPLTKHSVRAPETFVYELTSKKFTVGGPPSDIWSLAITIFGILSEPKKLLYVLSQDSKITLQNIVTKIATDIPNPWSEALREKGIDIEVGAIDEGLWDEMGASLLKASVRKEYLDLLKDMLTLEPLDRPACEEVCLRLSKCNR